MTTDISRRLLLKGLGVTVALPWLESFKAMAGTAANVKKAPQRFACMFIGDGISPPRWWAKGKAFRHGVRIQPGTDRAVSR
jgi:hypothetical protein